MSIAHIVEAGYIIIEPLTDPLEQPDWLHADSEDLLTFVTPFLGPTATLMVHRFGSYIAAGETWIQFELQDLAQTFGIGYSGGVNNPVLRTIERIHRFGFGQLHPTAPKLHIRTMIPPISRRFAERIPGYLADICPYIVR